MSTLLSRLTARFSRGGAMPVALAALLLAVAPAVQAQNVNLPQVTNEVRGADTRLSQDDVANWIFDNSLQGGDFSFLQALDLGPASGNAAVVQQGDPAAGIRASGNVAELTQVGTGNLAVLYQLGNDNLTRLLQAGVDNVFGVRLGSDDNQLDVSQIGNRNTYLLDYAGEQPLDGPPVVQEGNDIRAQQVGRGSTLFGIEQRGNGMDLTIRHNQ